MPAGRKDRVIMQEEFRHALLDGIPVIHAPVVLKIPDDGVMENPGPARFFYDKSCAPAVNLPHSGHTALADDGISLILTFFHAVQHGFHQGARCFVGHGSAFF